MNRKQARTILIGLSDDDYDAKVAVVDVVLDLVADSGQKRWTVDEPFTPKPWTPEEAARVGPVSISASVAAELEGLRNARDRVIADWRRIEKLVGREFTSPESVIDRVAVLVDQEGQLESVVAELRRSRQAGAATALQLAELLAAARAVCRDEDLQAGDDALCVLAETVARVDNETTREDT